MSAPYSADDARFDAEQQGRCVMCGRESHICGHCKECGFPKESHSISCTYYVRQHVTTDNDTKRTFCLHIQSGALVKLQELHSIPYPPKWEDVPQNTTDGADWWKQWESEVGSGAFVTEEKVSP